MLKQLNRNKKKKGFTLIELVIVLAVLAIIALIAIPNFTRVRNESLIDSDYRAAESIEKITLMGIANGDITNTVKTFTVADNGVISGSPSFADLFREANGPQVPTVPTGKDYFKVTINETTGQVSVGYDSDSAISFANKNIGPILAGANATPAP